MDKERFEQNPKNPKPLSNDIMAQRSSLPSILDRFKAMLKEMGEDFKLSCGDDNADVPPPSTDEIVRVYEHVLSELTFNSKPIITDLTIIAGEQREHAEGIVDVICARIIEVSIEQKLPSLYLLDSIVKNIGGEYVRHFSAHLPEVFCEAYRQVPPNLHPSMRHLFGTWSAVFPSSVLCKIEAQLQFSSSFNNLSSSLVSLRASESQRPVHGIHVNPKYLEARRQPEDTAVDSGIQNERGSSLKTYGQKPAVEFDEFDSDSAEVIPSQVGTHRLSPAGRAGYASGVEGTKLPPSSTAKIASSSSPSRIAHTRLLSPATDDFSVHNSPRRFVGKASPSHPGLDHGFHRVVGRDDDITDWPRNHWSDSTHQLFETSAVYNVINGVDLERPRALIDAYGNDERNVATNHKPQQVRQLGINGLKSKAATKTWRNSEEEEFDWEAMSPTLADHRRSEDFFPSSVPPPGSVRRPGFETHHHPPLGTDFKGSNWYNRASLPVSDSELTNIINGFRHERTQIPGSRYSQEAWNLSRNLPESSQHHLNAKGRGRNFQIPFSATGISFQVVEQRAPLINSSTDTDSEFGAVSSVPSRLTSSILDSLTSEVPAADVPASALAWPSTNMHKPQPPSALSSFPLQKQLMNASSALLSQGLNKSSLSNSKLESIEEIGLNMLSQINQLDGPSPLIQQSAVAIAPLQPQVLSHDVRQYLVRPAAVSIPSHSVVPSLNHGYARGVSATTIYSNSIPLVQSSMPILNFPNSSLNLPAGTMLPLPPGSLPVSTPTVPISQNLGPNIPIPPAGNALSGLISSLMAQGWISLAKQAPVEDAVGLGFNPDFLKVRHESPITALYADLPRQCTTCGLRFKCQEKHSSHMDWHVTKNRISKKRKQKPSRKWFVSESMWLSGAEAPRTDAIPGFLPTENVVEKKDDEEMAVPADEDQNVCALCGEPFDDFYSDETEEWMYRGAVYMNAPNGSIAGMDRSQLGPIVHAKCKSVSGVPSEDFGKDEGGYAAEGSPRKRMRS